MSQASQSPRNDRRAFFRFLGTTATAAVAGVVANPAAAVRGAAPRTTATLPVASGAPRRMNVRPVSIPSVRLGG
ncbi:MAG: hypothetical protein AMXMBFR64_35900 [Myxococcales bacterium]